MMKQSGFTLIEIMIALFIFALLAITVSFGFHEIISINNHFQSKVKRWNKLAFVMSMMQNDFNQMIYRPINNGDGQETPAFLNNTTAIYFTTVTFNPVDRLFHSDLQRVAYSYNGHALIKITWPVLDRSRSTKKLTKTILKNVDYLKFVTYTQPSQSNILPRAVEVDMNIKKIGLVKRIFMVTGNNKK